VYEVLSPPLNPTAIGRTTPARPRFIKLELAHQGGKQHKCADRRIKRFESFSSYTN